MMVEEIEIVNWARSGGMMYNTYSLDHDDPMHPYNQALSQGVRPEDFGLKHPLAEEFDDKSRGELIKEILALRTEVRGYVRAGF